MFHCTVDKVEFPENLTYFQQYLLCVNGIWIELLALSYCTKFDKGMSAFYEMIKQKTFNKVLSTTFDTISAMCELNIF